MVSSSRLNGIIIYKKKKIVRGEAANFKVSSIFYDIVDNIKH